MKPDPGPSPGRDGEGPPTTPTDPPEPGAAWFAWGIWAAMTAAVLGFVLRFGPEVPIGDDYAFVDVMAGVRPITPAWLWSLHNEHRWPMTRLVVLAVYRAAGNDFRGGMVFNAAALALLAAALILATSRVRGRTSYSDALFALALLNWGHGSNLLWCVQVSFVLPITIVGLLAVLIARWGRQSGPGLSLVVGTGATLLPLCGAHGLAMTPPLSAWLLVLGGSRLASRRPGGWPAVLAAIPALGVMLLYFIDFERPPQIDRAPGPLAVARTAVQVLAIGLGPVGSKAWRICGGAVLVLAFASAMLLVATARRWPAERPRASGLLAVLAGFGILTMALAWGRAGGGPYAGLEPRYVTLAAPIPCLAALCWSIYGPIALRRLLTMTLLVGICVLLWPNMQRGLEIGTALRSNSDAVLADVRSGVPPFALIARHSGFLLPSHDDLATKLPLLHRVGVEAFRHLRDDPPFEEVPVASAPDAFQLARWEPSTRTIEATGVDPWATFILPKRAWVAGLRIRYSHENGSVTPARFKLGWRRSDQPGNPVEQEYKLWALPTGEHRTMVVWIGAPIDSFRIQPDNKPCRFRIEELTLLVPGGVGRP